MLDQFSRSRLLFGAEGIDILKSSRVAVFGIGGVGSYALEALARGGIGALDIIDDDRVCVTNINRQLIATHATVGRYKVEVAAERAREINPEVDIHTYQTFVDYETIQNFDFAEWDYVIDAIDTVTGKLAIIEKAYETGVPAISCMGAGNKLDPTALRVADIYQTKICPLAKAMRRELKKRGIPSLKVVYSEELPLKPLEEEESSCKKQCICPPGTKRKCSNRNQVPGSNSFVPPVAGLIIAGEVIQSLLESGSQKSQPQAAEIKGA